MSSPVPAGIERIALTVKGQYALLLLLDGYPYVEMTARKHADYLSDLGLWKRKTHPSWHDHKSASLPLPRLGR